MSRPKGTPKTGGRKQGTPNKASTDIRTWVAKILDANREEFVLRLARLEDRDYIKTITGLLAYVVPKMSPYSIEDEKKKEQAMLQSLLSTSPESVIEKIATRLLELQTDKNE